MGRVGENRYDNSIDSDFNYYSLIDKPLLSASEEKELSKRILDGDMEARQLFIERNLKLVVSVARKYLGYGIPLMDLIQEGNIGLIKAVDCFDGSYDNKFSSYAVWHIRDYIQRAIYNKSRMIRIPAHVFKRLFKLKKVYDDLEKKLGRVPYDYEVADYAHVTIEDVRDYLSFFEDVVSLQKIIEEDTDLEFFVPDKNISVEDFAVNNVFHYEMIECIKKAGLSKQEMRVIFLRYGFYDGKIYTCDEIGKMYNITRQAVHGYERKAIDKLKEYRVMKSFDNNYTKELKRNIS